MATPQPPQASKPPAEPANDVDDLMIEPDAAEAERFRIEIERDAKGSPDDW